VVARLESHIDVRVLCALGSLCKSGGLGVRAPSALVESLADDLAIAHDHATHERVGTGGTPTALGELKRATEEWILDPRRRVGEQWHALPFLLPSRL